jgi:hypothetical protein
MKQIQSITIWYNGSSYQATQFNMTSISDNLIDNAVFYYQLFTNEDFQIATGNITMTGADYINYSTSTTANDYAYQWGTTQLNLTLV